MAARTARLASLAKINLDLRVLHKRPDGYHELRTVFQTISLSDAIGVEYAPGGKRRIELESSVEIADNLMARAAALLLDHMRVGGHWKFRLLKRIPMGGGLGGGSSNAAALLLAMPVLAGKRVPMSDLLELGGQLGSDVPFFLWGGAAVGLGRGAEMYPLRGGREWPAIVAAPGVHVSTAEAYRSLERGLTSEAPSSTLNSFQALAWSVSGGASWAGSNDFEGPVFARHPRLRKLRRTLAGLGAFHAAMSGSGSALFGIFAAKAARDAALGAFEKSLQRGERAVAVSLVGESRYRSIWWRQLSEHLNEKAWPPRSRYCP